MLASILRTVVPVIVGVLLGQALKIGLTLPEGAVTEVVTVVVTTAYYTLARLVEKWQPALGSFLLSLGLTSKKPVYTNAQNVTSLRA
ncbi:hypothetical protein Ssi03_26030 [Sphaerisporangium siamense]|uniref:Uncharacterized protein n=1 Tax=Sphaerisporangium siamense TaxID=795645 RepID=A0A7W7D4Y8_9ACTN|nr:hypothetical protein [Sphaerisporangium siamense]MBB4700069.1 hypothetical protein [Sphaerisporangium siamense]GII84613.1 hypothetical protein Ssi03_26030 [Sphaerisporangium siamense]